MIVEAAALTAIAIMLKGPTPTKIISGSDFARKFAVAAARVDLKGIPPSFALSVAALETGWGAGKVFKNTNNLFSITAGSSWRGVTFTASTGFVFRVYNSLEESIADFVRLISTSKLYGKAYDAARNGNSAGFFAGLQQAGYAGSDVQYAAKLGRTLEVLV